MVYIIDACDDYTEDIEKQYNPIAYRYELSDSTLPESIKSELEIIYPFPPAPSAYELIDWKNGRSGGKCSVQRIVCRLLRYSVETGNEGEKPMKDPYKVLNVSRDASTETIKQA